MKKPIILSLVLSLLAIGIAPCIGFSAVFLSGRGAEKFISTQDMTTGPAFDLCIIVWLASMAVLVALAWLPTIIAAFKSERVE